jgi:hypothetical protein
VSRLDRGRAHDVLRTDWRNLPPRQRETAFLDALEACIEPDPATRPTRTVQPQLQPHLRKLYLVLAGWSIAGSIIGILMAASGSRLTLLPFLTLALGSYATWTYLRTKPQP